MARKRVGDLPDPIRDFVLGELRIDDRIFYQLFVTARERFRHHSQEALRKRLNEVIGELLNEGLVSLNPTDHHYQVCDDLRRPWPFKKRRGLGRTPRRKTTMRQAWPWRGQTQLLVTVVRRLQDKTNVPERTLRHYLQKHGAIERHPFRDREKNAGSTATGRAAGVLIRQDSAIHFLVQFCQVSPMTACNPQRTLLPIRYF